MLFYYFLYSPVKRQPKMIQHLNHLQNNLPVSLLLSQAVKPRQNADPVAGRTLFGLSYTNSCHAGADVGSLSARFPDDTELASVIRGQSGGPMGNISAASGWSDSDMANAIAYLRGIE